MTASPIQAAPYTHVDSCDGCGNTRFELRLHMGRLICPECNANTAAMHYQGLPIIQQGRPSPFQYYRAAQYFEPLPPPVEPITSEQVWNVAMPYLTGIGGCTFGIIVAGSRALGWW